MIVVDVGCHPQGPEESVHRLIDRFRPDVLFGFDPFPDLVEGVECIGETLVVRRRAAAWTSGGFLPIVVDGICTGVPKIADDGAPYVDAVDLPAFVGALPAELVVLKLDAEGAEYPILKALAQRGVDVGLHLVLVEWHTGAFAHGWESDRPELSCPVEEW